ncbi:DUF883 family protein [Roseivivax sp. CAU 1753]
MAQSQTTARLKDVEADAKNATGDEAEALKAQLETLKADMASMTELMTELGMRKKDETLDAAKARYEALRRDGEKLYKEARVRADDAQDQAMEAIRRQPATAIGIAVGVGFLAGFLTSRK